MVPSRQPPLLVPNGPEIFTYKKIAKNTQHANFFMFFHKNYIPFVGDGSFKVSGLSL